MSFLENIKVLSCLKRTTFGLDFKKVAWVFLAIFNHVRCLIVVFHIYLLLQTVILMFLSLQRWFFMTQKFHGGGGGGGQRNLFPCLAIRWQYLSALSIVEGFYNHNTSPWWGWLFSWFSVSVLEESWCWESSSFEFQVSEADVSDLQFVQSGYILKCILSHDITLVSTAVLYTTTFLWYTIASCIPYLLCTFVFTFVPSVSSEDKTIFICKEKDYHILPNNQNLRLYGHLKIIPTLLFSQALRSDEGLTLETSAF